jgi:hypothetical protein
MKKFYTYNLQLNCTEGIELKSPVTSRRRLFLPARPPSLFFAFSAV